MDRMDNSHGKIKIRDIRKITDRRFVNLYEMRYRDRAGTEKAWVYASRQDPPRAGSGDFDLPDAVIVVAFHTERQQLVVIREFRVPLADYQYGLPAGLVDAGESAEECARREFAEETGLHISRLHRISPIIYSSSGMTDESVVMAYADCTGEPSNKNAGSTEDIETVFVSREEARHLCDRSDIKFDVKTWLVLSTFAQTGRV